MIISCGGFVEYIIIIIAEFCDNNHFRWDNEVKEAQE